MVPSPDVSIHLRTFQRALWDLAVREERDRVEGRSGKVSGRKGEGKSGKESKEKEVEEEREERRNWGGGRKEERMLMNQLSLTFPFTVFS